MDDEQEGEEHLKKFVRRIRNQERATHSNKTASDDESIVGPNKRRMTFVGRVSFLLLHLLVQDIRGNLSRNENNG
jgi:hypothetical protein